jgi:hypothetical protein
MKLVTATIVFTVVELLLVGGAFGQVTPAISQDSQAKSGR